MPTITVEKQDFMALLGRRFADTEVASLLDYAKGELKGYNAETDELKIELKDTNRPDLWCPEGIARQIRFTYETIDYQSMTILNNRKIEKQLIVDHRLRKIRPYIGGFIAKGVPVGEKFLIQMMQTQEKLSENYGKKRELMSIGIYNARKIAFPVYYRAIGPHEVRFVPLGYDRAMDPATILHEHPKGIEFGRILEGKDYYPILMDDNDGILSFAPIINSRTSGEVAVGDDHLFIEVTGVDPDITQHTANILAYNFRDRGFEIEPLACLYPFETPYGKEVISPYPLKNEVAVKKALFDAYLGSSYGAEDITDALRKYGLSVEQHSDNDIFLVSSYPYRQDYMHPVDVIEDFTISIGFDSFEPIMPEQFTVGHHSPMMLFEDRVRETMIGFGFEEVILNMLSRREDYVDVDNGHYGPLEIDNPMTESHSVLRNSLIPSLLKMEAKSFKSVYPHRVFEVGEVVVRDEADNHGWATRTKLAGMLAHAEANFSEMGSYLNHLAYLMIWDIDVRGKSHPLFIDGRSGDLMCKDETVGVIGEVHPEHLDKWGIKMPTVVFEVDLSRLFDDTDG